MALQIGQTVGQYQITEQLGIGGMATVYRAYHARLDRHVAIKVMHQALQEDPTFKARFEREAQIVARLEHPNIVPVYDYDEFAQQPYLVMKQIEGQTLKALMSSGPMPHAEIMRMMTPVASALDYAHSRGVLHRDIKPSNVILDTSGGTPYLTDFGLARIAQSGSSTMSGDMMIGTPHYMSPEQGKGERDITSATDRYSFGVVLYEMLTGRVPFNAETPYAIVHAQIFDAPPLPSLLNSAITPAIDSVLSKALAKSPDDRYSTAAALLAAYQAAVEEDRHATPVPSMVQPLPATRIAAPQADDADEQDVQPLRPEVFKKGGARYVRVDLTQPTTRPQSIEEIGRGVRDRFKELGRDISGKSGAVRFNTSTADGTPRAQDGVTQTVTNVAAIVHDAVSEAVDWARENIGDGPANGDLPAQVQKDWGDDEAALRRRAQRRITQRRELMQHGVAYGIVNVMLWVLWSIILPIILQGISNSPDLTAAEMRNVTALMQTLNVPLLVSLFWGVGLGNHALEVWHNRARNFERRRNAVFTIMEREAGPNWVYTAEVRQYRRVRNGVNERANEVQGFTHHLLTYATVMPGLLIAWLAVRNVIIPEIGGSDDSEFRAFLESGFPLLLAVGGWGFGLAVHGISTFGKVVFGQREQQDLDAEIERERQASMAVRISKPKNEAAISDVAPRVRLTQDGELTDSLAQEIDQQQQRGRR
jgi:tRNA A-37 threonylcarbamoyl transferase component Bud32